MVRSEYYSPRVTDGCTVGDSRADIVIGTTILKISVVVDANIIDV